VGSDLIRAQVLNAVITRGLKFAVGRKRPSGGRESLPSGHASASFASAAVLDSHFGPKVGLPAYAVAGFIGWTRVRDNAHWLTDVIVGGAIGAAVGRTVARGHRTMTWAVVPTVTRDQVAVHVVRVGR
jgi:membrane-associated phospholipid phosphatase